MGICNKGILTLSCNCNTLGTALATIMECSSNVPEGVKSYQKRVKSYHDYKHRAKAHPSEAGDIVDLPRNNSDNKLDMVKYVITDFV